jgi:hypothetical protein
MEVRRHAGDAMARRDFSQIIASLVPFFATSSWPGRTFPVLGLVR